MVQVISGGSGLKTRSLGHNTLGTSESPVSLQVSLSAVCPRKLPWVCGFKSHLKDCRSQESHVLHGE